MKKNISFIVFIACFILRLSLPSNAQNAALQLSQAKQISAPRSYSGPAILNGQSTLTLAQQKREAQHAQDNLALADALDRAGTALMDTKQYAAAEHNFRRVVAIDPKRGLAYSRLANAQRAQGKTADALQTYRTLFYEVPMINNGPSDPKSKAAFRKMLQDDPARFGYGPGTIGAQMNYVILLAQTGQWPEAVHFYEKALLRLGHGSMPKVDVHFNPEVPLPDHLQAAAHLVLGIDADNQAEYAKAIADYEEALRLQPSSGLIYFYYGNGLQRAGRRTEAKAAFAQAAQLEQGDVKAAAEKSLKQF